jgi:hypothetical protein
LTALNQHFYMHLLGPKMWSYPHFLFTTNVIGFFHVDCPTLRKINWAVFCQWSLLNEAQIILLTKLAYKQQITRFHNNSYYTYKLLPVWSTIHYQPTIYLEEEARAIVRLCSRWRARAAASSNYNCNKPPVRLTTRHHIVERESKMFMRQIRLPCVSQAVYCHRAGA